MSMSVLLLFSSGSYPSPQRSHVQPACPGQAPHCSQGKHFRPLGRREAVQHGHALVKSAVTVVLGRLVEGCTARMVSAVSVRSSHLITAEKSCMWLLFSFWFQDFYFSKSSCFVLGSGRWLTNNVMIVSGEQWKDSAIHMNEAHFYPFEAYFFWGW